MKAILFFILLAGCVDERDPLEIDGRIYECVIIDAADGRELDRVNQCGPEDDPTVPAWEVAGYYQHAGGSRAATVECFATELTCNRKDD